MKIRLSFFAALLLLGLSVHSSAFANSLNVSLVVLSDSTSTATSTPDATSTPPVATSTTPQQAFSVNTVNSPSYPLGNKISGTVNIVALSDSATVSWESELPALMTFSWGRTTEYEIGSHASAWPQNAFEVDLVNLKPDTRYYYTFALTDASGKNIYWNGSFQTRPLPDVIAPVPPDNFRATINPQGILFNWTNPDSVNFSYVRLVRSQYSYPTDPLGGKVVYEGGSQYARDPSLDKGKDYYYSIFSADNQGNFSSPAVLHVLYAGSTAVLPGGGPGNIYSDPLLHNGAPYYATVYPPSNVSGFLCSSIGRLFAESSLSDSSIYKLPIENISFTQASATDVFSTSTLLVRANQPVYLSMQSISSIVPGDLITLCLSAGSKESQKAFILSLDKNTGLYTGALPAFDGTEPYKFYIGLLKANGSGEEILANAGIFFVDENNTGTARQDSFWLLLSLILIPMVTILTMLFRYLARRR
jgi:hypothetical protein